jgi:hypothetical protein
VLVLGLELGQAIRGIGRHGRIVGRLEVDAIEPSRVGAEDHLLGRAVGAAKRREAVFFLHVFGNLEPPIAGLVGSEFKSELAAHHSGEEPSDRVRLPTRHRHDGRKGRARARRIRNLPAGADNRLVAGSSPPSPTTQSCANPEFPVSAEHPRFSAVLGRV